MLGAGTLWWGVGVGGAAPHLARLTSPHPTSHLASPHLNPTTSPPSQVDKERMASQKAFYAELQRQESDMKSGGQAGMNPHLKKKGKK